jgi:hypothetical protein
VESQQLERALAALEAGNGRAPSRRSAKGGRRPRGGRRSDGRARRGANREQILAAVAERPGSTVREIADATGIARATVASTVTRLAANGTLARAGVPGGRVGFSVA